MSKLHIIYIPGLGDNSDELRQLGLKTWRLWGVSTELIPMQWNDGEQYSAKLARVLGAIDAAKKAGYLVAIVGESAGGSMAINATAARRSSVASLLTICGVDSPSIRPSATILRKSPAFKDSIAELATSLSSLDLTKVQTISALIDGVVYHNVSTITGARNFRVLGIGHLPTIALCLTVYSWYCVFLIKRNATYTT